MKEGKSFQISKHLVLRAYKCVKANKGAGGIDGIKMHQKVLEIRLKKSG